MPARRIRVDVFDSDGNRYSVSFEGQVTRDKAVRLLDMVELLGGIPPAEAGRGTTIASAAEKQSKYDRVRMIVQREFSILWFTSRDVQSAFEREIKEPIGLSTVATYLARMAAKGLLLRSGASNNLKYKTARPSLEATARRP